MDPVAESAPVKKTPMLPQGTRVLLAEDTSDSRRLLTIVLEKAGAEVTAVDQGQAAVDRALEAMRQGRPFDAIVLDMAMPLLNGYEAAGRLRAEGYCGPIIALTAHVLPGEREKCLAAGCDDHVGKPIDRTALVNTVARRLAAARPSAQSPAATPAVAPEPARAKSLLESLAEPQRSRLLKDFVEGLIERVEKIEDAVRVRDSREVLELAHAIHGTAYLFSSPEIAQCAGRIEHMLREESPLEAIEPDVARLASLCRAAGAKS